MTLYRRRILAVVAIGASIALAVGCGSPETARTGDAVDVEISESVERAERTIDTDALRDAVSFLASDELEGRAPASEGDGKARRYLAAQLASYGFQPAAANGTWEQPFEIVGVTSEVPKSWEFKSADGSASLKFWDEFIAWSDAQATKASVKDAELVFVGYGIHAPEYDWDDYKGEDLNGRVLLMLNNDPDWDDDLFAGSRRLYYGRWDYKYESAAAQGAVGAIVIHTRPSAGYPWGVVQNSWTGEQFELPSTGDRRLAVAAWATADATRRLLAAAGHDLDQLIASAKERDFRPVPLGLKSSLEIRADLRTVSSANVIGRLAGSDSSLAGQGVIYTAHHDHLGVAASDGENAETDRIYNGALDNGAGMAQVLAIARAFGGLEQPPRRSIWVAFVGAEEQGLLGSKYFAENPPIQPGRIAANLNFDGGNIWGRALDVPLVGYGKSDLDGVVKKFAKRQGRRVVQEAFPDRGSFYRSDQFSLAKVGVPAIYIDTGVDFEGRPREWGTERIEAWEGEHYHQPSDELTADWVFDGMVEDARLGFVAGWYVAEQQALPRWNAGDEFEATRLRAIEAADSRIGN